MPPLLSTGVVEGLCNEFMSDSTVSPFILGIGGGAGAAMGA